MLGNGPVRFGRGSPGTTRLFLTGTAPGGLPRSPMATECPYVVGGVTSAQSGDRESRTTG
jgi:hypothetical protein